MILRVSPTVFRQHWVETVCCVWPRDLTKLGQLLHPPRQSKSTQRFQISLNGLRDIAALSMRLNFSSFSQKALKCWHSFELKQMISAKLGDTRSSDLSKQLEPLGRQTLNNSTHIMDLGTNSASKFLQLSICLRSRSRFGSFECDLWFLFHSGLLCYINSHRMGSSFLCVRSRRLKGNSTKARLD